jgi:ATP-dependent DNA helicase Rep
MHPRPVPQILERCRAQWRYLLCDESQDTNRAQFELVRLLLGDRTTFFAVGDPNQVSQ